MTHQSILLLTFLYSLVWNEINAKRKPTFNEIRSFIQVQKYMHIFMNMFFNILINAKQNIWLNNTLRVGKISTQFHCKEKPHVLFCTIKYNFLHFHYLNNPNARAYAHLVFISLVYVSFSHLVKDTSNRIW